MSEPQTSRPPQVTAPSPSPSPRPRGKKLRPILVIVLLFVAAGWIGQSFRSPTYQGQTLTTWRTRLHRGDPLQRTLAVEALTTLAPREETTLADLRERAVQDSERNVREMALASLAHLLAVSDAEPSASDMARQHAVFDALLAQGELALESEHALRALRAVAVLTGFTRPFSAPLGQEYHPRLIQQIVQRVQANDAHTPELLALLGEGATLPATLEEPLLTVWSQRVGSVRVSIVRCLIRLPVLSSRSLPALLEQLATPDLTSHILPHLKRLGPVAVPVLVETLRPGEPRAVLAQEALRLIGPAAVEPLDRAWKQGPLPSRVLASQTLARLGPVGMARLLPGLVSADPVLADLAREAFLSAGLVARDFLVSRQPAADPALQAAIAELLRDLPDPATQKSS